MKHALTMFSIFLLLLTAAHTLNATVTTYTDVPDSSASTDFTALTVDGTAVYCAFLDTATDRGGVNYARFACDEEVSITLTAKDDVTSWRIGPTRLGISPTVSGKTLSFSVLLGF